MHVLHRPHRLAPVFLLAAILLAGCGGKEAETDASAETATAEELEPQPEASAPAPAAQPAGTSAYAPLTTDDIGRWEKGMAAEMQAVEAAGEKLKSGRTAEDTANAMMAVQEMSTADAGAQATGLEPERYRYLQQQFSSTVAYLTPPELEGMDTTKMPAEMRAEVRQGREKALARAREKMSPEVIEALRPRAVELRKKSMELVGARFKAAGIR